MLPIHGEALSQDSVSVPHDLHWERCEPAQGRHGSRDQHELVGQEHDPLAPGSRESTFPVLGHREHTLRSEMAQSRILGGKIERHVAVVRHDDFAVPVSARERSLHRQPGQLRAVPPRDKDAEERHSAFSDALRPARPAVPFREEPLEK